MARTENKGTPRCPLRAVILAGTVAAAAVLTGLFPDPGDAQESSASAAGEAKNAIFMMGDGMGPAHRDAIQLATVGPYGRLAMDRLPVAGLVGTNAVESTDPETFVTDSAAGATAFATGTKTFNGAVGVDVDGNALPTVLEQAKAAGKAVGLVTTSQVTDASPAAFAAHVEDRYQQSEIARQYLEESRPDVILGGGEDYWYPEGNEGAFPDRPDDEEVSRSDRGNLVARAEDQGYEYVTNAEELSAVSGPKVLGLFANEEMFQQAPETEDASYDPAVPLPEMTAKAIEILSRDPDGFFLFVEEEGVDEMSHFNNSELVLEAGQDLDDAVTVANDFAEADGETLLTVTADHECGGLTAEATDDPEYPDESGGNEGEENANISVEDGPFPAADSGYDFVMDWTTTGHTGVDVPLTATGPGSAALAGLYENTAVYDVVAESLGVGGRQPADAPASGSAPAPSASVVPDTGGVGPGLLVPLLALLAGGAVFGAVALLRNV